MTSPSSARRRRSSGDAATLGCRGHVSSRLGEPVVDQHGTHRAGLLGQPEAGTPVVGGHQGVLGAVVTQLRDVEDAHPPAAKLADGVEERFAAGVEVTHRQPSGVGGVLADGVSNSNAAAPTPSRERTRHDRAIVLPARCASMT